MDVEDEHAYDDDGYDVEVEVADEGYPQVLTELCQDGLFEFLLCDLEYDRQLEIVAFLVVEINGLLDLLNLDWKVHTTHELLLDVIVEMHGDIVLLVWLQSEKVVLHHSLIQFLSSPSCTCLELAV